MSHNDFSGRVALVTGGSRGIGRAIALQLAREGADVAFSYASRPEPAKKTLNEIEALGRKALAVRCDVSDPVAAAELAARVGTVLRRVGQRPTNNTATLDFGDLAIDVMAREVKISDELVETTAKEFDLLAFLASSPRQVFTREQLLAQVWGSSSAWQDAGTVTEHVRRIRRKIEKDPDHPRWVRTVRGVGYRFEP